MKGNQDLEENLLIEGLRSGSELAFEYIFKKYYRALCIYSQKYVGEPQAAEDVVSRVFARLWKNRKKISISRSIHSYLFQSVYHESLNYLNSFSRRQQPTDSIHLYLKDRGQETGFLSKIYADEFREKINRAIDNLPDRCREIFQMSRNEELPHKEIAVRMNISVRTVENQIGIALEKLRKVLKSDKI